jgi:hypothetical protein
MSIVNDTGITFTGTESLRDAMLGVAFARLQTAAACFDSTSQRFGRHQLDMAITEFKQLLGTPH